MIELDTTIELKLSDIILKDGESTKRLDLVMGAGIFKVEKAYVDEAPGDLGYFKGGIKPKRNRALDYAVESTAKNKNFNYPLALFTGTGKLKGKPDFGFTTGRVRAGEVAYGIGGIRPNKAALRARKRVEPEFIEYIRSKIDLS